MLQFITKLMGLAPLPPKTGAREAAVLVFLVVLFLTVFAMLRGPETISALTGVLVTIWPSALAFMAFAFKIKSDQQRQTQPEYQSEEE